jgi:hypothetical protein
MKAEHRKELQTNTLADVLGRTVRNVRSGGTGLSWTKIIIIAVLVLGVLLFVWWKRNQANRNAEMWVLLDDNTPKKLEMLGSVDSKDTTQGKAAILTSNFGDLFGTVRLLGSPDLQDIALKNLEIMQARYSDLVKMYAEDPEWQAEAKYGLAVATEGLAAKDPKNLEEAKRTYEELAKGSPNTGFGVLAARRLEQLNDPVEGAAILVFYSEFKTKAMAGRAR